METFKKEHNIQSSAKNVRDLIQFLDKAPNQRWYVFKAARGMKGGIINLGSYESFPIIDDALGWFDKYGGGKYFIKCESIGKRKVGFYEFDGGNKKLPPKKFSYKPKDAKEALILAMIEDGDQQFIDRIINGNIREKRYVPLTRSESRLARKRYLRHWVI